MIDRLIQTLQQAGLVLSDEQFASFCEDCSLVQDEDIADALWLALRMGGAALVTTTEDAAAGDGDRASEIDIIESKADLLTSSQPASPVFLDDRSKSEPQAPEAPEQGFPIQVQAAPALPESRALGRALRPLMRKVPSLTQVVLDEAATVERIAEQDVWVPVVRPTQERWFDLELVIEASPSTFIWESTCHEFRQIVERQGAFRNVRTWRIENAGANQPRLTALSQMRSRSPKELIDPSGRRLVLLVSDCRSRLWRAGAMHDWLKLWGEHGPAAVVQLLPAWLWRHSELDVGFTVQVGSFLPGATNSKLQLHGLPRRTRVAAEQALTVPIVTLTPDSLCQWAQVVAAAGRQRSPARLFDLAWVKDPSRERISFSLDGVSSEARLELFEATASPIARRLAGMMAAVPVSLDVVHLIQRYVLPEARAVHVAEVYGSGLLKPLSQSQTTQDVRYEFADGVRALLNQRTLRDETLLVWDELSKAIARTLGLPKIKSFTAFLSPKSNWTEAVQQAVLPFAQVMTEVLHRLGGDYAELARRVEEDAARRQNWISVPDAVPDAAPRWPEFRVLELETVRLVEDDLEDSRPENALEAFEFQTATISRGQNGKGRSQQPKWVITKQSGSAYRLMESLPNETPLEMVQIPAGRFLMGSPEDEPERLSNEGPQHEVEVREFLMGRYPITQAQWRAVAQLPQIGRALKPDPSRFKGDNRPVEQVSWYDATEFCQRLSQHTGREYRLPSEAEWEYACRAGTTTPFHFGETLTTELANYDGNYTYGDGPKGEYREETTEVGSFPPNAFGLCDMHGNVWEWCQDYYHDSYADAPNDGSAWTDDENEMPIQQNKQLYVQRGGSWIGDPWYCRSAQRGRNAPSVGNLIIGFRVVCVGARAV